MNPEVLKKPKEEKYTRESLYLTYSPEKQERLKKRFWSNVDIKSVNECWNWKSYRYDPKFGYGGFKYDPKTKVRSHRICWVMHFEIPIKKDLVIAHSCDNAACCNPEHIFMGNHRANSKDAFLKGRVQHSKCGKFMKLTDPDRK